MNDEPAVSVQLTSPDQPVEELPRKKIVERIGILVVHGIGEQNRNEHLQSVAKQIVNASSLRFGKNNINVEMFPGADNLADLSILIRIDGDDLSLHNFLCIDLHEVWWRDLNQPATPWSVIQFWLWAATFAGTRGRFHIDTPVTISPSNSNTQKSRIRIRDRALLFMKITYFFVLLFPIRVSTQLINILPGIRPINLFRTIFSYMSSVQIYQQRRGRKGGTLVDFDQSLRISIQRRFVNALVTMAELNYDRWYVMGHSLGSVIALKGLVYPEDAFARFMSFNRWYNPRFTYHSTICVSADYPDKPHLPGWLKPDSALKTTNILERCRGFISWGSPLETFARTWPEMVHLNRAFGAPSNFEWINLYDPVDVVASTLTSYHKLPEQFRPMNFACRSSLWVLSAHTSYLKVNKSNTRKRVAPALLSWMLEGDTKFSQVAGDIGLSPLNNRQIFMRRVGAGLQWLFVLVVGLLIWPVSVGLFIRVVGFLPKQIANFLLDGPENGVDRFFNNIDNAISKLQPTLNLTEDSYKFLVILGIVILVLSLGGFIHYVSDYIIEKIAHRDRATGNRQIAVAYSDK